MGPDVERLPALLSALVLDPIFHQYPQAVPLPLGLRALGGAMSSCLMASCSHRALMPEMC